MPDLVDYHTLISQQHESTPVHASSAARFLTVSKRHTSSIHEPRSTGARGLEGEVRAGGRGFEELDSVTSLRARVCACCLQLLTYSHAIPGVWQ